MADPVLKHLSWKHYLSIGVLSAVVAVASAVITYIYGVGFASASDAAQHTQIDTRLGKLEVMDKAFEVELREVFQTNAADHQKIVYELGQLSSAVKDSRETLKIIEQRLIGTTSVRSTDTSGPKG